MNYWGMREDILDVFAEAQRLNPDASPWTRVFEGRFNVTRLGVGVPRVAGTSEERRARKLESYHRNKHKHEAARRAAGNARYHAKNPSARTYKSREAS